MKESKTNKYKGYTEAQKKAHKRYMQNYCEIKVRMTPNKRTLIQEHAKNVGESVSVFINRAIDETMENDKSKI